MKTRKLRILLGAAVILFFFALPIARLVLLSVQGEGGWSFGVYEELLRQKRFWDSLRNTAIIVAGSTLLSTLLGAAAAWLMAYTDIAWKKTMHLLILLCFILPSYVLTLSWSSFMGSQGPVAQLLEWLRPGAAPWSVYSMGGIVFVMGIHHFPLVYLFTVNVLKKIPRDLEWAAGTGGAGRGRVLLKITLPMALPGLTAGGLLVFLASLDNFGIPAFLGTPVNIRVLSTLIYEEIIGFGPSAFARGASLSVILGLIAVAGTLLQWMSVRRSRQGETYLPDEQPRYHLGRHRFWAMPLVWGSLLLMSIVPLLSMVSLSLRRSYGGGLSFSNLTFDNYRYILLENAGTWRSIQNSLQLSVSALAICLVIGTAIAYLRVRRPSRWNGLAELIISVPYTLPGIVFALSMILAWMEPVPGWNPGIYGTTTLLLIAYVCRFLVLQIRSGVTAFSQIDPALEEAASVSGAGTRRRWLAVLLPLLLPGLLGGGLLVFLTALTELTVSALLYSSGSQTIGVAIFGFEQAGSTLYSTAMSSLIVVLIFVGAGLLALMKKMLTRKRGAHTP
ncbi:ABC transporter permease [Saccharibacillus alkalitolerans]|uniref:Iron ABC transporter permease n=1 Tax=Saccharibacillus alkalitolerans TaxID=2705290 RepID=A0ABX0F2B3_9BACL|nr:iron ABC transporter permease [Saccharibacillus alkalitolerans]NGZ74089.1 iron ABC transporter permease [Saccharibacillus alkalitolerans]